MRTDSSTPCRPRWWAAGVLLVLAAGPQLSSQAGESVPRIAAAVSLNVALPEIAERFHQSAGSRVELVFGSSGNLTRQIRDGAPYELFLSADEEYVNHLVEAGLTRDRGTLYATGRVVLFAPDGSPLLPSQGLAGVARLLDAGRVTRFAIANPEHAPYGRAAEAALRKHGLWERIRPRLVVGDTVAQAAQFATTGNAIGGILPHSLVRTPALAARGTFALLPEADHPPLRQRMVLLKRAGPVADRFYAFLQQQDARAVLRRHGFDVPE